MSRKKALILLIKFYNGFSLCVGRLFLERFFKGICMSKNAGVLKNIALITGLFAIGYWYFHGPGDKIKSLQERTVSTLYGDFKVTEPVLCELLDHEVMQRIKHVEQYGIWNKVVEKPQHYTRYSHCVGVWALLKRYGASLEEQIAGLLHDASHTAFSHVADYNLFGDNALGDSYQDDIHGWYLKQQGVDKVLEKHGFSLDAVLHKGGDHSMLGKDLPDICCDRLEYNLEAGILTGMLTREEVLAMLNDIQYENGNWFFNTPKTALNFARVSLYNTENVWGSPVSHLSNTWFAKTLDYAIKNNILTFNDMHFSVDDIVWDKLQGCDDEFVQINLNKILAVDGLFDLVSEKEADISFPTKFRGIDPLVKTNDGFKRLTDLDKKFKAEYLSVKKRVAHWYIKFRCEDAQILQA